jgi:hypothetical protein
MPKKSFFSPGQTVVLREMWDGRVWRAGSYIVVQDSPELIALYAPLGTVIKYPLTPGGKRVKPHQKIKNEWALTDLKTDKYTSLRLTVPGAGYSVLIFWNCADMSLRFWYINLEDPLYRTPMGFDLMDQILDVIVKPDLSGWHWKDEDELAEAVDLGLISKERADALYKDGERVANWIQSGKSPFNGWEKWRPDPSWKVPTLPEGWDRI